MTIDPKLTSYHQHAIKPVLQSRVLDDMSDASTFELTAHTQDGQVTLKAGETGEFANFQKAHRDEKSVMRLNCAVMAGPHNEALGRGWGGAILKRPFNGEDWSDNNRISFEVFPDLPGFRTVSLCVYLYNDGEVKNPDHMARTGMHFIILQNHQWNFCTWEFPDLCRDKATGIGFEYRMQGAEPGASQTVTYDFANLKLETVDADHVKGWQPKEGAIVFSHTGYTPNAPKTAIANGLDATQFQIMRADDGSVAFEGKVRREETHTGTYDLLDFSPLSEEGRYYIKVGSATTKTFNICKNVWRSAVEKVINSFFCLRCGYPVPGIHDICHEDFQVRYGDIVKVMNGGWHDAGDLSQGIINSAEAAYTMMALSTALKNKDANLAELLYEEARWGQMWVLKTRFPDGHRASWLTLDIWTDGVIGTADDIVHKAVRRAYDNFVCAATEALAAQFFKEEDTPFARYNLQAAEEDFAYAVEDATENKHRLDICSQGALAAIELYKATGKTCYLDKAVEYASIIVGCQQTDLPDWKIPMRGFFYTSTSKEDILHYPHRGHEQAPLVVLCKLHALVPHHENAAQWLNAIKLYAEYIKGIVKYTAPYHMLPASIYSLDESHRIENGMAEEQIKQGIQLSDKHYLRLFPVWADFRGNSGTILSTARGVLECAMLLQDNELLNICRRQLEWHVGRNPFNQSLIWGEGYNFTPQYSAVCGDIVGTFPVGVQTQYNEDVPYWPDSNCYNYKEVWVHPASRWLWLMEHMYTDFELTCNEFSVNGSSNLVKTLSNNNTIGAKVTKVKFTSKNEHILPNIYPNEFVPKGSFVNEGTVDVIIEQVQCFHNNTILTFDVNQVVSITVQNLAPPVSVLDYFYQISGKSVLTAMHNNDHDKLRPSGSTDRVYNDTGVTPAIWSNDFLYNASYVNEKQRTAMIDEMIKQWNNGAIVQLLMHVAPPTVTPEEEAKGVSWNGAHDAVISDLTDAEWDDLLAEGGALNTNWKHRLDVYAKHMQRLKDAGVVFLFRPFHEMNQHVFWWGGRPKVTQTGETLQSTTAGLFRMTRDYLEKEKGLDNIIWVWDMQDLGQDYGKKYHTPYSSTDWAQFNPGDDYWDIFALDIYDNTDGTYTAEKYKQAKETANKKPFAIGECFKLPEQIGVRSLTEQPEWTFFMPWGQDMWEHNSLEKIRELYQNNLCAADTPRFKCK